MSFQPTPLQVIVLWRLLFTGEEPMISQMGLDPKDRLPLEKEGLIHLEKRGRANHAILTDKAWRWAGENLQAEFSPRATAQIPPTLRGVLARLEAFLVHHGLTLADFLSPPQKVPKPPPLLSTEQRIAAACLALTGGVPNLRVRLADLRRELADIPRATLDRTLLAMQQQDRLVLLPLDDPQEITPADTQAVLKVLGHARHILYFRG